MKFSENALPISIEDNLKKSIDSILEYSHRSGSKLLTTSLLHQFVSRGDKDATQYLLHRGCNVDARDSLGMTPLMIGVLSRNEEIIKILLASGANMLAGDNMSRTTLSMLCADHESDNTLHYLLLTDLRKKCLNSQDCARKLIDAGCQLFQAAYINDAEIIEYMLKHGLSSNSMHPVAEMTTLHVSVAAGNLEILKLLLQYGADVTAVDSMGRNALSYLYSGHYTEHTQEKVDILRILLDLGVAPTSCDNNGFFQIAHILNFGNRDAIHLIFQSNMDFTAKDLKGNSILHHLAPNTKPDIVEELKLHIDKLDVNSVNYSGITPLHGAANFGNVQMMKFLLEQGADSNCATYLHGRTPLYYLCARFKSGCEDQYEQCVKLLFQNNADSQFVCTNENGEQITIFDVTDINRIKSIVAHIALLEGLGTTITTITYNKINENHELCKYFHLCCKVLKQNISGSVTLMKLLTSDKRKMTKYLGNRHLALKLKRIRYKQKVKFSFLYYYNSLEKYCLKRLEYRRLQTHATKVISKIFGGNFGNTNLVIDEIVNYLTDQNLRKLCQCKK